MLLKHSNDNIGNRTRNLPARSAVPQPTVPPREPVKYLRAQYPTSHILASNKCHKKLVTSIQKGKGRAGLLYRPGVAQRVPGSYGSQIS